MKKFIFATLLLLLCSQITVGSVTAPIQPVAQDLFRPVVLPNPVIIDTFKESAFPIKPIFPVPIQKPRSIEVTPTPIPTAFTTSQHISGKASWYCKAGVSICHHSYPPGSMVAAACGKLRKVIGPNWRGKTVSVTNSSGKKLYVRLVDWCGSTTKLIDLYWEPMRRLGGTGVLFVTVRW